METWLIVGAVILGFLYFKSKKAAPAGVATRKAPVPNPIAQGQNTAMQTVPAGTTVKSNLTPGPAAGKAAANLPANYAALATTTPTAAALAAAGLTVGKTRTATLDVYVPGASQADAVKNFNLLYPGITPISVTISNQEGYDAQGNDLGRLWHVIFKQAGT